MKTQNFINSPLAVDKGLFGNKGVIAAANEDRMTSTTYSEPVTNFITGLPMPEYGSLLDFVAPAVRTSRRFEFKRRNKNDHFVTETDDQRAIGSAFKKVEYRGETEHSKTFNKGLTITVDEDDVLEDGFEMRYAAMLKNRCILNELMRALAVLKAGANNTAVDWSTGTPDPDGDLNEAIDRGGDKLGLDCNRIAFGKSPWTKRQKHYRTSDTPYAGANALMTPESLGNLLGVDALRLMNQRYQATKAEKGKILSTILFFNASENLMKDDPSNIKRFWSPTATGGNWRVHVERKMKTVDITVEHYSNIIVTESKGLEMLTVS